MSRLVLKSLALMAIFAGNLASLPVSAQGVPAYAGPQGRPFPDMSKSRIESPVKGLLKPYREVSSDRSNTMTYGPIAPRRLTPIAPVVAQAKPVLAKPAAQPKTLGSTKDKPQQSEKVEPGKVRWHKAIQTAMDASRQSGKPVLLFQMMGRLDDRFC